MLFLDLRGDNLICIVCDTMGATNSSPDNNSFIEPPVPDMSCLLHDITVHLLSPETRAIENRIGEVPLAHQPKGRLAHLAAHFSPLLSFNQISILTYCSSLNKYRDTIIRLQIISRVNIRSLASDNLGQDGFT
jgi:hypothetical protein